MKNVKTYLTEGLLIVFSVLFALLINKLFEDYKTNERKTIALETIQSELYRNLAIVQGWKEEHMVVNNRITDILEGRNDSLKNELLTYNFLNLSLLTNNQYLINAILTNTAWESAKTTGIISEFDFNTIQKLTYAHTIQELVVDQTIPKISDFLYTDFYNIDHIDQSLLEFQFRLKDLLAQEELITNLYQEAIDETRKYVVTDYKSQQ